MNTQMQARTLMAHTFPMMDVIDPVRDFVVYTTDGRHVVVSARDTVDALKMVDGEVVDILDRGGVSERNVVLGASRKAKHL